ncbi:hypothetical protein GQ457_11G027380 [Hibiscus cannabinus]
MSVRGSEWERVVAAVRGQRGGPSISRDEDGPDAFWSRSGACGGTGTLLQLVWRGRVTHAVAKGAFPLDFGPLDPIGSYGRETAAQRDN